ncbi:hypothetical protein BDK51DRAFT_47207 [Blyttiomyces helicus]|uniref:Uncharacterized protein n=1 Tax=Blyttiomyces helicus TaxID=388810 RepID=A0A4P9WGR4_9FUNG|nr:hypothetical protein BDK51DRAFT_47207 [Blyttiomyces helicus]|eukprot:RKO91023.1 hypothetical protein BDK51DRAFT_47207 [Blyttiomyces helicus]
MFTELHNECNDAILDPARVASPDPHEPMASRISSRETLQLRRRGQQTSLRILLAQRAPLSHRRFRLYNIHSKEGRSTLFPSRRPFPLARFPILAQITSDGPRGVKGGNSVRGAGGEGLDNSGGFILWRHGDAVWRSGGVGCSGRAGGNGRGSMKGGKRDSEDEAGWTPAAAGCRERGVGETEREGTGGGATFPASKSALCKQWLITTRLRARPPSPPHATHNDAPPLNANQRVG